MDEVNNGLRLIYKDIRPRPERRKKSDITFSLCLVQGEWESNAHDLHYDLIKQLLDMDNPVFATGGNYAEESQRTNVDTLPALWAAPDYPLVLVGSTDHGGARSYFSPRGPEVTLRQPASDWLKGGCDSIYKALYNEYTLWGAGWHSADLGAGLQAQFKGCAFFSLGAIFFSI